MSSAPVVCAGGARAKAVPNDAANASIAAPQVPIIGFVLRSAPLELRPIIGIVGAALIGDALPLPSDVTALAVSPDQRYGLASRDSSTETGVLSIGANGAGPITTIPGAVPQPDEIEFGPTGSVAVLYSKALQRLQVITGLPSSPRLAREIDVSSLDAIVTLGISDDAEAVLAGTSGGVILLAAGNASMLVNAASPSRIRFLSQTHDALVSDSQLNRVILLADVTGAASSRIVADATQGISSPLDVDSSPDRQKIVIANSGGGNVLLVDIGSGNVTPLACQRTPSGLRHLPGTSFSAVSASDSDAFWLLDAAIGRLSFIPAPGTSR